MAGITREKLIEQLRSINEERAGHIASLHQLAGAEKLCQGQLLDIAQQERAEVTAKAETNGTAVLVEG